MHIFNISKFGMALISFFLFNVLHLPDVQLNNNVFPFNTSVYVDGDPNPQTMVSSTPAVMAAAISMKNVMTSFVPPMTVRFISDNSINWP